MNIKASTLATNFFLFLLVVMPAGSFMGVNVKIISVVMFFFSIFLDKQWGVIINIGKKMIPMLIFLILLVSYSLLFNSYDEFALSQAKDIAIFFLVFFIIDSFYRTRSQKKQALNVIINALVFSAFIKIFMITYSVISGTSIVFLVKEYGKLFDMSLMTYTIEDSSIGRIQFLSDFIVPIICYYMVMCFYTDFISKIDIIKFILIVFSVFVGMSRFYWFVTAMFILLAVFFNIKNKRSIIFIGVLFFAVFAASFSDSVQKSVTERFSQNKVSASDSIRKQQMELFTKRIDESPILGKGLGYYVPEYQQTGPSRYTYELQVPALIMQIGLLGVFLFIVIILLPFVIHSSHSSIGLFFSSLIMVTTWFISGFFNPVLFSSAGGAAYASILLIFKYFTSKSNDFYGRD